MAGAKDIHGFVLAGGKSRRMGQDKARMRIDGQPLVLRGVEILRPFVREVTLLASPGQYADLGVPVLADRWPDQGPLAAVCTGLLSSTAAWNIFLACDLPLLNGRFLELLVKRLLATSSDAVVPRTADDWQPLSAAYHSRCRAPFLQALEAGERRIINLLEVIPVEPLTPAEMLQAGVSESDFANMNTPGDYARVAAITKGGKEGC